MKILFICKYNRLRSKIAEALFNYYNKDNQNEAKSAGIRTYFLSPFIVEKAKKLLEQRGVKVESDASMMINDYLVKWADRIVVVANDVDRRLFPKNKVIVWEVEDIENNEDKIVSFKIDEIEAKVRNLIEDIGKLGNSKTSSKE
jgi:protein-tyrosine-phosphatase